MIILGLDPGIARTGFGILNTDLPALFVRCGIITTPPAMSVEDRLVIVGQDIEHIVKAHQPDVGVVEQVFFGKNSKTALLTAQVRGVLLYVLRQHRITINSLTPLQIKSRLTGYGAASKEQVQQCVARRLHLSAIPEPDDAADALAAALSFSTISLTSLS